MVKRKEKYLSKGFTLIELLVALSLISVLSAIGIATYTNFNRIQLLNSATKKVVQDLRYAQSMAENNQKPDGCDDNNTLKSYSFEIVPPTSYKITAQCSTAEYEIKSETIPLNLEMAGFSSVEFKILRQGIVFIPPTTKTLTVTGFTVTKTITVGNAGNIFINE